MFVLGIALAFGKASVFKYISDDYPQNIGAVSGIVGLAGGMGGFVLPIMFGALVDLTGVRSSAFMLMYGVVWVSLIWMYWTEVRRTEVMGLRCARRRPSPRPPAAALNGTVHGDTTIMRTDPSGAQPRPHPDDLDPRRQGLLGRSRARRSPSSTCGSRCPALFLAFAVWQVWSVVAVNLPSLGFHYSTNQLFWLAAAPALSGATLRIFYSFMVPIVGGRRWTAISTASLLIPAIGIGFAVQDNTTSYPTMLVLALLCGLGGGNFSSSMANISFFFPKERKGSALGVNAGLGNLGVSVVQFLSPLVVTVGIFGIFGGDPQTIVQGRPDDAGLDPERGVHLGAVDRDRVAGGLVRR